jgi:hypothetical protein
VTPIPTPATTPHGQTPTGRSSRFEPTPPPPPSPPPSPMLALPSYAPMTSGFDPLVERWRPEITRRAQAFGMPVDGILQWLQIESRGDMCAPGSAHELGIFQLNFPDDAKYGATLDGLRSICQRSAGRKNPSDLSWMTPADLEMEVGAGIRKIVDARDQVRRVFAASGVTWPENSYDFWSAVKQIHATPAVINELVPKIARQGPITGWADLRKKVMAFPVSQMGPGLQRLSHLPSQHGLRNRLEDTMRNAAFVGLATIKGPIADVA